MPYFTSIILRRELRGDPNRVTGATVRFSEGGFESIDCCEDRAFTIDCVPFLMEEGGDNRADEHACPGCGNVEPLRVPGALCWDCDAG